MSRADMREFWDAAAGDDAYYFVDNRLDYGSPDLERFWAGGEQIVDFMLAAFGVEIRPEDSVVEIGCGLGRLTRVIAQRCRDVRAVDVSERMLELAREHNPELANVDWILGDGVSLRGVPDASADACMSWVVFQHIPDPAITLQYVREIGRVLRPGGWAVFLVSNNPELHRPPRGIRGLRERILRLSGRVPRGSGSPAWLGSAVDLGELREAARSGEMDVVGLKGEGSQWCLVFTRRR